MQRTFRGLRTDSFDLFIVSGLCFIHWPSSCPQTSICLEACKSDNLTIFLLWFPYFRHIRKQTQARQLETAQQLKPLTQFRSPSPHQGSLHFISPFFRLGLLSLANLSCFASFDDLTSLMSSSSLPASAMSSPRTMNSMSSNSTTILLASSKSSKQELVRASACVFWSLGTHPKSISKFNLLSWQETSIRMMLSGNLQLRNLCTKKAFPRLSVIPVMCILVRRPVHLAPLPNKISAVRIAVSSSEAIARNGSPFT